MTATHAVPRPSRRTALALRALQAGMMVQILLGLTRFFGPSIGLVLSDGVWVVHPLLGTSIAVAATVLLRPRPGVAATVVRQVARFAPFAPLTLGAAIAAGLPLGSWLVPLHMALGLGALGVLDTAIKQQLAAPGEAPPSSGSLPRPHDDTALRKGNRHDYVRHVHR